MRKEAFYGWNKSVGDFVVASDNEIFGRTILETNVKRLLLGDWKGALRFCAVSVSEYECV